MIDIQQMRKDLLRSLKTPKKIIKGKSLSKRTVLPLNQKVMSGISQVISNYFEGTTHNRIRKHKSQSISIAPIETIHTEKRSQRQHDTAHLQELLKKEKKRILKPNMTLQDEIVVYLNKIKEKEAITVRTENKRKPHRGSTHCISYLPCKNKGERSDLMESFIADCEESKEKCDTDKKILKYKIRGINKVTERRMKNVEKVISKNNQMECEDYNYISKHIKQQIQSHTLSKLRAMLSNQVTH